jgi:hypothetical protein
VRVLRITWRQLVNESEVLLVRLAHALGSTAFSGYTSRRSTSRR